MDYHHIIALFLQLLEEKETTLNESDGSLAIQYRMTRRQESEKWLEPTHTGAKQLVQSWWRIVSELFQASDFILTKRRNYLSTISVKIVLWVLSPFVFKKRKSPFFFFFLPLSGKTNSGQSILCRMTWRRPANWLKTHTHTHTHTKKMYFLYFLVANILCKLIKIQWPK